MILGLYLSAAVKKHEKDPEKYLDKVFEFQYIPF